MKEYDNVLVEGKISFDEVWETINNGDGTVSFKCHNTLNKWSDFDGGKENLKDIPKGINNKYILGKQPPYFHYPAPENKSISYNEKDHLCNCDEINLFRYGCKCGGK